MTGLRAPDDRLAKVYGRALCLYPAAFRARNGQSMLQAFRDALADRSMGRRSLLALVVFDLCISLIKEHLTMLRDTFGRPVLVYNALVLAALSTGLALALFAIPQQVLRQGANDPQIQMSSDMASILNRSGVTDGLREGGLLEKGASVDMAQSLAPFLIVYNDQGQVVESNAQLNGQTPTLPKGVFEYVRNHGEERVTWEPVPHSHSVRIAAVVERVSGPQPGFVLAGRSMREVEMRISQVGQMARLTWIGMLGVIAIGTALFGWYTRPKAA